jgi:uncharacterized phage protein (TIGR01671 family)
MREIKFRAWNADRHIMFQVGDDFGTTDPLDPIVYFRQGQPVILMQFTGLLDKNGKEIYEGDILKYQYYLEHGQWGEVKDFPYPVIVEWNLCQACFTPLSLWTKYTEQLSRSEVIGNIYEHSHLLEKK